MRSSCCSPEESTGASGVVSPQPRLGPQGGSDTGALCLTWPSLCPVTKPSLSHWELAFRVTHTDSCVPYQSPGSWCLVFPGLFPWDPSYHHHLMFNPVSPERPSYAPLFPECFLTPYLRAVRARGLLQGADEWLGTGGGRAMSSLLMLRPSGPSRCHPHT